MENKKCLHPENQYCCDGLVENGVSLESKLRFIRLFRFVSIESFIQIKQDSWLGVACDPVYGASHELRKIPHRVPGFCLNRGDIKRTIEQWVRLRLHLRRNISTHENGVEAGAC